jgi:hypothetical protein
MSPTLRLDWPDSKTNNGLKTQANHDGRLDLALVGDCLTAIIDAVGGQFLQWRL